MKFIKEKLQSLSFTLENIREKAPRGEIFAILMTVLIVAFTSLPINDEFINRIQHPIQFKLRSYFGLDPKMDERIKIYGIDDTSVAKMKKTDVSLEMWGKIIKGLSEAGAEYIFIDKLFGTPGSEEEEQEFYSLISEIKAHIIIATYMSENESTAQHILNLEDLGAVEEINLLRTNTPRSIYYPYGTTDTLQDAFDLFGHVNYQDDNHMRALFPIGMRTFLPPAVFQVFDDLRVENGKLQIGEEVVPVNHRGKILVNLADADSYWKKQIAFSSLYFRAKDNVSFPLKDHQKIVVIHGGIYTGGTDYVDTALGQMPGGFVHFALLNSALNRDWIRSFPEPWLLILFFCWLGYYIAHRTNPKIFVALSMSLPIGIVVLGLSSFIWMNWNIPWLNCTVCYLAVTGVVFLERMRKLEVDSLLLRKDLELGRTAQELFMPDVMKGKVGSYSYTIVFKPWGPLSGDWVQTYQHGDQAVIAIGDVVGKGPSAALNTSVIATIWSEHCVKWTDSGKINIEEFAKNLNYVINRLFRGKQFTTFSCIVIEGAELKLFNIGAPPWYLLEPLKGVRSLRIRSKNPLGIEPDGAIYNNNIHDLTDQQTLIAYTDGVMDGTASRRFLNKTIKKNSSKISHDLTGEIVFKAGVSERLADDYTLLIVSKDKADEQKESQAA